MYFLFNAYTFDDVIEESKILKSEYSKNENSFWSVMKNNFPCLKKTFLDLKNKIAKIYRT